MGAGRSRGRSVGVGVRRGSRGRASVGIGVGLGAGRSRGRSVGIGVGWGAGRSRCRSVGGRCLSEESGPRVGRGRCQFGCGSVRGSVGRRWCPSEESGPRVGRGRCRLGCGSARWSVGWGRCPSEESGPRVGSSAAEGVGSGGTRGGRRRSDGASGWRPVHGTRAWKDGAGGSVCPSAAERRVVGRTSTSRDAPMARRRVAVASVWVRVCSGPSERGALCPRHFGGEALHQRSVGGRAASASSVGGPWATKSSAPKSLSSGLEPGTSRSKPWAPYH